MSSWAIDATGRGKPARVSNGVMQLNTDMHAQILTYNQKLDPGDEDISDVLAEEIGRGLPGAESKIWDAHPVWFLDK